MALQMLHKNHHTPLNIGMRQEQPPPPQPFNLGAPGPRSYDDRSSSYEREMGANRFAPDPVRDPRSRDPRASRDPRGGDRGFDPRGGGGRNEPPVRRDSGPMTSSGGSGIGGMGPGGPPPGLAGVPPQMLTNDPARNQLIMQVLQLTDDQISMLPVDQRMSIMELKKQINAAPK